jgi:hypothetical protein
LPNPTTKVRSLFPSIKTLYHNMDGTRLDRIADLNMKN